MSFLREDGVEAAWAIVDPILRDGSDVYQYAPGSGDRSKPIILLPTSADGTTHKSTSKPSFMIMTDQFEYIRTHERLSHTVG